MICSKNLILMFLIFNLFFLYFNRKLLNHPKGSQLLGAMFGGGMAGAGGDDEMDIHEIPTPQPSKPAEKPKTESSAKKPAENAAKSNLTEEQKKVN
jgi:hypothetical protein